MFFIIVKLNEYAAIAQSVERILGKDEVASSNLASSSRKVLKPQRFWDFSFFCNLALYHVFLHFPSIQLTITESKFSRFSVISGFSFRSPIIFSV